jgi:cytosine/adenosine deaminase-related metal-dependent hydrolase
MQLAYRNNYRADAPLRRCFAMVTENPAILLKLLGHGDVVKVGLPANLPAVRTENVETVILQRPPTFSRTRPGASSPATGFRRKRHPAWS